MLKQPMTYLNVFVNLTQNVIFQEYVRKIELINTNVLQIEEKHVLEYPQTGLIGILGKLEETRPLSKFLLPKEFCITSCLNMFN